MVTIRDVAKKAGVSIASVSYALNNKAGVNDETKKRIKEASDELGYIPNSLAQGLISRKTNIVGLIAPDFSDLYMAYLIQHLNNYARENDYFLLLGSTSGEIEKEKAIVTSFLSRNIDAIIFIPHNYASESFYKDIIKLISKRNIPLIFANMSFPGIRCNNVAADLEEGEYRATKYLLENGFRKLMLVGGKKEHYYSEIRYNGFLRALNEYGIEADNDMYIESGGKYSFAEGYNIIDSIMGKYPLPEAFVAINDSIAYGMIKRLKERGITVPQDVSIIGFDDIEIPSLDSIKLTTIRIPVEEIARLCIETIKDNKSSTLIKQYLIQPELIIRETVLSKL